MQISNQLKLNSLSRRISPPSLKQEQYSVDTTPDLSEARAKDSSNSGKDVFVAAVGLAVAGIGMTGAAQAAPVQEAQITTEVKVDLDLKKKLDLAKKPSLEKLPEKKPVETPSKKPELGQKPTVLWKKA